MYYIVRLNKHYFLIMGLNVVFFDYPIVLVVLAVILSSIDSQAIGGLCFFHVVGPKPTYPKLHIVLFWVSQLLLLIIHIGRPGLCLINLLEN